MADETKQSPSTNKALVFLRRSASTLGLWGLVAGIFLSRSAWAYLALMAVLVVVATVEYFRMARAAGVACFPKFGTGCAVAYCVMLHVALATGHAPSPAMEGMAVFFVVAGSFVLQLARPITRIESLVSVAVTTLGVLYIPVLFNFAARTVFLVPDGTAPGRVGDPGAYLLLWLLAVTKFTDMGAYLTGSLIGKHKMIPHVSPGKTWEGFAGAIGFALLAGWGLYALFPEALAVFGGIHHVIMASVLLALLAVLGDLAESVVKRALDAKDSGKFLPGIGGSLDLIDSLCFTAPALWFYLVFVLKAGA